MIGLLKETITKKDCQEQLNMYHLPKTNKKKARGTQFILSCLLMKSGWWK